MAASTRVIAVFAAGALLSATAASPASAARSIEALCPPGTVYDDQFSDTEDDFFERAILCLREYGITLGLSQNFYAINEVVRREQLAVFVYRIGLAAGYAFDTGDSGLSDLDEVVGGPEAVDAVNGLVNAGVLDGFDDGTFRPAAFVKRDATAKYLVRSVEVYTGTTLPPGEDAFTDDEPGNVFEPFIDQLAALDITDGFDSPGTYLPDRFLRRNEMAGLLSRHLALLFEEGLVETVFDGTDPTGGLVVRPDGDTRFGVTDPRTYTAGGLVPGTEYRINLVNDAEVQRGPGTSIVFEEDPDAPGLVFTGTRTTDIVSVDGAAPVNNTGRGTPTTPNTLTASPTAVFTAGSSGSVTFVLDGESVESVFPVVYVNGGGSSDGTPAQGGVSPRLEIGPDGLPTEPYDNGGVITWFIPT